MVDEIETEERKELDLTSADVVTKYKAAAEIANKALATVAAQAKAGAKVLELCELGDKTINELSQGVFKNAKKKIERGVAFPTCVSVNNIVCHYSAAAGDEAALANGDVVKIDLAAHIDGFIASAAHTVVVQEDAAAPVTGKAADVIAAANTAAEVALRLVRPGKHNKEVAEALQKVAEAYGVHVVEGVLSHQMKQFVIDANKVVLSVSSPEMRVEDFEFEANEVYAVDIVMSSGEGKPKLVDEKQTMVYKRAVDKAYSLKLKASRAIFSEISQKFSIMPFTARALETKAARLGLVECVNHDLLQPYPVLHEKQGDMVAHIKFTVLLMPNGSDRITSATLQTLQPTSELQDADVKAWLAMSYKTKKKTTSKKKAAKEGLEALLLFLVSLPLPRPLISRFVPLVLAALQPLLAVVPFCLFFLLDVYWKYEFRMDCRGGACTSADRDRYQKSVIKSQRNFILGLFGIYLYWVLYRYCVLSMKVNRLEAIIPADKPKRVTKDAPKEASKEQ
ncbi:unnamed protein product [Closterium sp. NIES-65]|nr:unnamed protein product [Closterium sp. NIES-65]